MKYQTRTAWLFKETLSALTAEDKKEAIRSILESKERCASIDLWLSETHPKIVTGIWRERLYSNQ